MTIAKKSATAVPVTADASVLEGLEPQDAGLGPGWGEEIVRRIHAVERGESRLIEGAEVMARVRKALRMV